jgi:serine protease Do
MVAGVYWLTSAQPFRLILVSVLALTLAAGWSGAQAESGALSSAAELLYGAARPKLLQIRTLLAATGEQSSIGSGFLAGADRLAITNYHVVSQAALEPETYRLEYVAADGHHGEVQLLAIDLPNDLALLRLDQSGAGFFALSDKPADLPKGERLYSMGNPLDLGFTIVEGTYNGLVERSYNERIHFTGALNPGMSGGPTLTGDGRLAGINVAKKLGGELVSFLVPARFAAALVARARGAEPLQAKDFRAEIGRQLAEWQAKLHQSFAERGFRRVAVGPYAAPESSAPWFTCWSQTNAGQVPKPRASIDATNCNSDTQLFIAGDLTTGIIHIGHALVRSVDLNPFQFAAFLTQQAQASWVGGFGRKWLTQRRCHEDFVAAAPEAEHPALRAVWCARAYREFAGLYDVSVTAVTEDRGSEALVSRLALQAIGYDDAMKLTRLFLEDMQWTR